jgi:hypothetical protein
MSLFKGKKAQGNVYLAITIFLFCYALIFIISYLVLNAFITGMQATSIWNNDMQEAANGFLRALAVLDYMMVIMTIVLIIGVGITSYRLAAPPIFFIINLIVGVFYGFFSYFFNYLFIQFVGNSLFTATLAYFPRTMIICTNLHWITLVCIVVGSITLFAKKPRGQYV